MAAPVVMPLSAARAGEGLGQLFGGTGAMPFRLRLTPEFTYYSDAGVDGQSTEMGLTRYGLSATGQLYRSERDTWTLSASARILQLDTDAVLPEAGDPLSDDLMKITFGLGWSHKYEGGSVLRTSLNIGSASDEPFGGDDRPAFMGMLSHMNPTEEGDAWITFLLMTNNHEALNYVPIPGVAYLSRGERHTAILGFPFAWVNYRPAERWAFDVSYFPITSVRAKVTYKPRKGLGVYAGYDWRHDSHFRSDRRSDDDRLFYYEMRGAVGLKTYLARRASVDISVGCAFDRFMFEGEGFDDRDENRVDLGDTFFTQLKLRVTW